MSVAYPHSINSAIVRKTAVGLKQPFTRFHPIRRKTIKNKDAPAWLPRGKNEWRGGSAICPRFFLDVLILPGKSGKIISEPTRDDNIAVGGIGILAR